MRHSPYMQRYHQGRRTFGGGSLCNEPFGRGANRSEGAVTRFSQFMVGIERDTSLEHGRIIGWLGAGELEISATQALEGRENVRPAIIPGPRQRRFEQGKAPQRHVGQQFIAVAEMPVRRSRADASKSRRLCKGEPGGPLAGDQIERCTDQRLLQVTVVVTAGRGTVVLIPCHVKGIYIMEAEASTRLLDHPADASGFCGNELILELPLEPAGIRDPAN